MIAKQIVLPKEFATFSDSARVWIYQADRLLIEEECDSINKAVRPFCESWVSHNNQLSAYGAVIRNAFLLLMVDEVKSNKASGCSIDSSVHFVQQLGATMNVDFFNRMCFAYHSESGIQIVNNQEFKNAFDSNQINESTLVYNNLVQSKNELLTNWVVPLQDSWHKRFV